MPAVYDGFVINGSRNGDTWTIEVMAPWLVLNGTAAGGHDQWNMTYPRKAGDKVIYNFNTMDYDGTGSQVRYGITENGARVDRSLENWQQFTLVNTPAGIKPVEIIEEEPEAPAPEAPAVTTPAPSAPKTSDNPAIYAVMILVCAVVLALGFKVSKKIRIG